MINLSETNDNTVIFNDINENTKLIKTITAIFTKNCLVMAERIEAIEKKLAENGIPVTEKVLSEQSG